MTAGLSIDARRRAFHVMVTSLGLSLVILGVARPPVMAVDAGASEMGAPTAGNSDWTDVDFRRSIGFSPDAAMVESLRSSGETVWWAGMPFTKDEYTELESRMRLEDDVQPAIAALDKAGLYETFAGIYIDQVGGGRLVLMLTDASSADVVRARVSQPDRLDVRVAPIPWEELESTVNDVRQAVDAGDPSVATVRDYWIDTRNNAVAIGITPEALDRQGNPPAEFRDAWPQREITTHPAQSEPRLDRLGWDSTAPPIKGGNGWGHNGQSDAWCTSGFKVQQPPSGTAIMMTAGHCVDQYGLAQLVYHRNQLIGTTWIGSGYHDFGFVSLTQQDKMSSYVYYGSGTASLASVVGSNTTYTLGAIRCFTGRASNQSKCGPIINSSWSAGYQHDLCVIEPPIIPGDSGSPAYKFVDAWPVDDAYASGIAVAGAEDTFYEKWSNRPSGFSLW